MQKNTLAQLQKISVLKNFKKDEYICYEGQLGDDMYIILSGEVGVYLTNTMGALDEIARIKKGDFFGEMALFDRLPRSASCIALEDTICVAINKDNIGEFLEKCPEMVEKILVNMSLRIRDLDNELHRVLNSMSNHRQAPFTIPTEYARDHFLDKPYQDPQYLFYYSQTCPICGKEVSSVQVRRNILQIEKIDMDGRIRFASCDPLWHDVISCPNCNYSNHYLSFAKINPAVRDQIRDSLKQQEYVVDKFLQTHKSDFDQVVLGYLQAVYLNEMINAGDSTLLGTLWLNLYWLSRDVNDEVFAGYCAQKAVGKYVEALGKEEISAVKGKCSIALSLANLLIYLGKEREAWMYCGIAERSMDERIRECVLQVKLSLVK